MPGCSVLECGRPTIAKGMCWNHYQRERRGAPVDVYLAANPGRKVARVVRFGPPLPPGWSKSGRPPRQPLSLESRFWARIDKNGPTQPHMTTPCWRWLGFLLVGYASMRETGQKRARIIRASHVSWRLHGNGDVPADKILCHQCDNPECTRPDHLYAGTDATNMADAKARDRHSRGSRSPRAKLTEAAVIEIRQLAAAGVSHGKLAARFGVAPSLIHRVVHGINWAHVPMP